MQFEVAPTTVLGRPALTVRGEPAIATAPRLAEAAESLLSQQPQVLVVDRTGTTLRYSSGARQRVHRSPRSTRPAPTASPRSARPHLDRMDRPRP